MKEVRSRKTGKISILSDEEYEKLVRIGLAGRFTVQDIKPIRPLIPDIKITPEIKIKTKVKSK
jgi:hypothetical protein